MYLLTRTAMKFFYKKSNHRLVGSGSLIFQSGCATFASLSSTTWFFTGDKDCGRCEGDRWWSVVGDVVARCPWRWGGGGTRCDRLVGRAASYLTLASLTERISVTQNRGALFRYNQEKKFFPDSIGPRCIFKTVFCCGGCSLISPSSRHKQKYCLFFF